MAYDQFDRDDPTTCDVLLYYPDESRAVVITIDGLHFIPSVQIHSIDGFSNDWTSVVGNARGYVLFYRARDGHNRKLRFSFGSDLSKPPTLGKDHVVPSMGGGWTNLFVGWGATMFYNVDTADLVVHYGDTIDPEPAGYSLSPTLGIPTGMTHVLQMGTALFLTDGTTNWAFTKYAGKGGSAAAWNPSYLEYTSARQSWTSVASNGEHIVFFDASNQTFTIGDAAHAEDQNRSTFKFEWPSQLDAVFAVGRLFLGIDGTNGNYEFMRVSNGQMDGVHNGRDHALLEAGRATSGAGSTMQGTTFVHHPS